MMRTEGQLERLNGLIRTQESRWTKLGEAMERSGQRLQTFGRGMTSFGRGMTMRVTTPILGAGAAALKVGMDFEEGMSRVQAISGASAQEIEKLTQQGKEWGERQDLALHKQRMRKSFWPELVGKQMKFMQVCRG